MQLPEIRIAAKRESLILEPERTGQHRFHCSEGHFRKPCRPFPMGLSVSAVSTCETTILRRRSPRVAADAGTVDVLVSSAWGGYERMVENGQSTWALPFWEQPFHRWNSMMDAGVRAALVAAGHAARIMVPRGRGLIVNVSYWAAQKHIGNIVALTRTCSD